MARGFNDELQKLAFSPIGGPIGAAAAAIPNILKGVQALGPVVGPAAKEVATQAVVGAAVDKLRAPGANPGQ